MIIAILNQHHNADRCVIARNLAVLRARSGRKVCLVAAGSAEGTGNWCIDRNVAGVLPSVASRSAGRHAARIEWLRRQFNDIVVDAGERNTDDCHGVLVAASLALVPVRGDDIDLRRQYDLIERIRAARLLNHGLRTLFVAIGVHGKPTVEEQAAVHAHVSRLDGALLAKTSLRDPGYFAYGPGRCVCDAESCDPEAAQEMHDLYDEVYGLTNLPREFYLDPRVTLPMLPGRALSAL